jgi:hypothetical protein
MSPVRKNIVRKNMRSTLISSWEALYPLTPWNVYVSEIETGSVITGQPGSSVY